MRLGMRHCVTVSLPHWLTDCIKLRNHAGLAKFTEGVPQREGPLAAGSTPKGAVACQRGAAAATPTPAQLAEVAIRQEVRLLWVVRASPKGYWEVLLPTVALHLLAVAPRMGGPTLRQHRRCCCRPWVCFDFCFDLQIGGGFACHHVALSLSWMCCVLQLEPAIGIPLPRRYPKAKEASPQTSAGT
mmetsp:Transcript_77030/g.160292  ORF Transcript_77030/g.160292 Transcript_77030/m.160292 type:complete len:186 (+) Transcript_77030:169-726(+)|eukprot:CAMPEP_0194756700 /NCGR_PEP_ID=MMETSP0323_2-20130528/10349_1 /TAXON_ID=2866 ORGANISM="Crypthecodinium cohnii, Strain Seligo" /NCGR_SAMPLE_ID=MMETSP0323_2 /ASSEMBLY_ACC=CAM_ASM_000346 /LENGTH=185 /DNA_ID=CAMNT_0039676319 /DNA_START=172 /DNA_END=729 /DNA_ORIENTATION=-